MEYGLVIPPELFEKYTGHVQRRRLLRSRQRVVNDFSDASVTVNGIQPALLRRVECQKEITVGVALVDQNARRPRGAPVLDTDLVWHANGHVVTPGLTVKIDRLRDIRAIVAVDSHTMTNHRSAKQLGSGVLLGRGKLRDSRRQRNLRQDSAARRVWCLLYPSAEG